MAAIKASHTPDSAIPDTAILKVTPARFAHVDHSPTGALTVLNDHFPDTATALTKSRWSIINIWRPLKPIKKDPLALCDTRSVPEDDLVPVFAKLPPKGSNTYEAVSVSEGWETLELKANPDHQWYYASDMMPDEVLVFKMFDSKKSVARRVPHTSFTDPRAKNDAPRESMEVRSFVFYDDEPAE